ncbi:YigZ family protein [Mycoplasma anatis]|uniref:YigZ family protein n=1 Tax=Mycoplasmopsis anatis TaxID=171279 RepID=UPI001C4E1691|nr:YigZ family protein [Mycoplasmopsis anatis]MBW0594768.1 YigZ family protein [Mycoplasmopsis anatis]MBW0598345.1 YigZ family protein [Mycoplasmopsis anatis]MBW0599071.1 YigZ family protein [Mycoplasmopsis anatis]MBW0601307.1 YigZ family protein [Mycoplasmopsis anatis]MBW0603514.1 YigZ family protein [Mycoplasmopsis anatis]
MHEIVIKKSTFYSKVYEINNKKEVTAIVQNLKKEYKKARHVCYAYLFINENKVDEAGYDDDGEPKHTAGRPILDLIQLKNVKNVLVVVVRYFGGVKLGAGGLIRAYRQAAQCAIDNYLIER